MKIIIITDEELREQIVEWSYKNAYPDVIQFTQDGQGRWFIPFDVVRNPKFEGLKAQILQNGTEDIFVEEISVEETARRKTLADFQFGSAVIIGIMTAYKELALSNAQLAAQLTKLDTCISLLQVGAIQLARNNVNGLAVDAVFTQQRKDLLLAKLDNYLQ
jgi:hypothetical protein